LARGVAPLVGPWAGKIAADKMDMLRFGAADLERQRRIVPRSAANARVQGLTYNMTEFLMPNDVFLS